MQGNVLGQSGGNSKINGLIEEYKVAAGENVKAGDFVEYDNTNIKEDMYGIDDISSNSYSNIIEMSENKFVTIQNLVYYDNYNSNDCHKIRFSVYETKEQHIIKTLSEVELTLEWPESSNCLEQRFYLYRLDNNHFFTGWSDSGTHRVGAGIFEITEDNIVTLTNIIDLSEYLGGSSSSSSVSTSYLAMKRTKENNKYILVFNKQAEPTGVHLLPINIDNNFKITIIGIRTQVTTEWDQVTDETATTNFNFRNNIIFIRTKSDILLRKILITEQNDITVEAITAPSFDNDVCNGSFLKIDNRRFAIIYYATVSSNNNYYAIIYNYDDELKKLILVKKATLVTKITSVNKPKIAIYAKGDNAVMIYVTNVSSTVYNCYQIVINFNDNIITLKKNNQLTFVPDTKYMKVNKIDEGNGIMFIMSNDTKVAIIKYDFEISVKKGSKYNILGIAKTKGTEGQIVKVYIPNIEEGGN